MTSCAIYAHYSGGSIWEPSDLEVIKVLASIFDRVEVVTTSPKAMPKLHLGNSVHVTWRPNVGYDFFSYKVGLSKLGDLQQYSSVLLANSSFLCTSGTRLEATIRAMVSELANFQVVGLTKSKQIRNHLQSFLLLFRGTSLASPELIKFWKHVSPVDSKSAVIANFEIGLSDAIASSHLTSTVVHRGNAASAVYRNIKSALIRYLFESPGVRMHSKQPVQKRHKNVRVRDLLKPNLAHVDFAEIEARHGLVKKEVLSINPLRLRIPSHLKDFGHATTARTASPGYSVVRVKEDANGVDRQTVAVVFHAYHEDLIDSAAAAISNISAKRHVFVTTSRESLIRTLIGKLSPVCEQLEIRVVENVGRDVKPFIGLLVDGVLSEYDVCLKIHTKKSAHSPMGALWQAALFNDLAGSPVRVAQILGKFRNDPKTGIIAPKESLVSNSRYAGDNLFWMRRIRANLNLQAGVSRSQLFVAGTMFWFRPAALAVISTAAQEGLVYQREEGQVDGTLAHAWERMFCSISDEAGFTTRSSNWEMDHVTKDSAQRTRLVTF